MTKVECPQVQTHRRRPICRPSWLSFIRQQPIFELERVFDGSYPYMKFGRNQIKNDYVRVTKTADGQTDGWTDRQTKNNRAPPTFVGLVLNSYPSIPR